MTLRDTVPVAELPTKSSSGQRRIHIVEDHSDVRGFLRAYLEQHGYVVTESSDGHEALVDLAEVRADLMLLDMRFPRGSGIDVLRHTATHYPDLPVIIVTETATLSSAAEATRLGAHDVVEKPVDSEQLLQSVRAALAHGGRRPGRSESEMRDRYGLVGRSLAIDRICDQIDRAAESDVTLLITGESGTGKEAVAQAVHRLGSRGSGPFVPVNCGALPTTLIETELFGHAKGSFTGAVANHSGRFVQAHGGTLFLDEIGEMALGAQAKLLRVLETKTVHPLGSSRPRTVDVRVIAATNRDLARDVDDRRFREDLFYRLNVVPIELPPLRDRPEDIADLARHFLRMESKRSRTPVKTLDPGALHVLVQHAWPGNVRELSNIVQRIGYNTAGPSISAHAAAAALDPDRSVDTPLESTNYKDARDAFERRYLRLALVAHDWRVRATAEAIGLDRVTLWRKMKQLGIQGPQ